MTLPFPATLERADAYAPIVRLLQDAFCKPKDLARRWGFTEDHLANLRRRKLGPPWIRLPTASGASKRQTGAIRYRVSAIIAAELIGSGGALTYERVALAVSACDFLTEMERVLVLARLKETLG